MTDIINIYKEPCAAIFSGKPLTPPEPAWKSALMNAIGGAVCILLCAMFGAAVIYGCMKLYHWISEFISWIATFI